MSEDEIQCIMCEYEGLQRARRHGVEVTTPAVDGQTDDDTAWVCPRCVDEHTVLEVSSAIRRDDGAVHQGGGD